MIANKDRIFSTVAMGQGISTDSLVCARMGLMAHLKTSQIVISLISQLSLITTSALGTKQRSKVT